MNEETEFTDRPSLREEWKARVLRLAEPVLGRLASGRLRAEMPIEGNDPASRPDFSQLEVVARTLVGMAPWLELARENEDADALRLAEMARAGLALAADPKSSEAFNFTKGSQPLVDAAFLAEAFLRAPHSLWRKLDEETQHRIVEGMRATRSIQPPENNWWLFAALIEAFLITLGEEHHKDRLETALHKHDLWYVGDGTWGDGPEFRWDYYNSFVIQPMLTDIFEVIGEQPEWLGSAQKTQERSLRYAAVLERLVAPDGSFPVIGRSLAYRCGAFHSLAQSALLHRLPTSIPPARARRALTLVIRRTLDAPDTFDANGWLRIGLCGHQPGLGETYISTASLYLCTCAFLPLGLPDVDPFWTDDEMPTSSEMAWSGINISADSAHKEQ